MKNWTITARISGCIAILTLIICALAYTSREKVLLMEHRATLVSENSVPTFLVLHEIGIRFQEVRILVRTLMQDGLTDEQRRAIEGKIKDNVDRISELNTKYGKELVSDDTDKNLFNQSVGIFRDYLRVQARVFDAVNASIGNQEAAWQIINTEMVPTSEKYLEQLRASWDYNDSLAASSYKETQRVSANTEWFVLVMGIGGVAIAVVLGTLVTVSTTRLLKRVASGLDEVALQVASAATQVSGSSQALSTAASEQASSVEETSASLEEMTSMLHGTSENAEKAKSLAAEAHSEAADGSHIMSEMMEAMEAINTSSAEVASIVKEIDQIAFQTNILALNAAVEAARAGEAGAGFAVVADEVRALARRSAAAAQETATKIEVAIANTRNGSASSAKVGESLTKIAERVASTDQLVGDITRAAKEQALGIEQINSAISQMEKVSQSNASSAEESASAAQELDVQAEMLKAEVEQLRKLVGGKSEAGPATPVRRFSRPTTPVARHQRTMIPMPGDRNSDDDGDFRNF